MPEPTNGYVRWRDLTEHEHRVRTELRAEYDGLADSVSVRFDKAHNFYSNAVRDQMALIEVIDGRLDHVEAVLDHQNGAWTLAKFLIGSNLALTVVGILTLLTLFR